MSEILNGNEVPSTSPKRTQVYLATHEGEDRLPFLRRSFISFSYGGKNIEDFNLLATISGDRLERDGYASFNDITSSYDVLPGQFYWTTTFKTNELNFHLSTDSITEKQLNEFMHWFQPGEIKELVLAEHPNRAILMRVKETPQISMVPFDMETEVKLGGIARTVKTVEYRGDIELSLTSDDPHWYSRVSVFGTLDQEIEQASWTDINGNTVSEQDYLTDPDILKIIAEDGIPVKEMIKDSIWLADDIYAVVENNTVSREESVLTWMNNQKLYCYYAGTAPSPIKIKFTLHPVFDSDYRIICPKSTYVDSETPYNTITLGKYETQELRLTTPNIYHSYNRVIDIISNNIGEGWPTIRSLIRDTVFHLIIRDWAIYCIDQISNNSQTEMNAECAANIKIRMRELFLVPVEGEESIGIDNRETLPATFSIDTGTGEMIGVFQYQSHDIAEDQPVIIEERTSEDVTVRGTRVNVPAGYYPVDTQKILNGVDLFIPSSGTNDFYVKLPNGQEEDTIQIDFSVDTQGNSNVTDDNDHQGGFDDDDDNPGGDSSDEDPSRDTIETITESVQDMCVSDFFVLKNKDSFNSDGYVEKWADTDDTTKSYSHYLMHDFSVPLENVEIEYKNLYL